MSRKQERLLIKIMGIWQIIDGLFTIIYYGIFQRGHGLLGVSPAVYPNGYMMVITGFGGLLMALGIINLLLSTRYIKDDQIYWKIGFFLLVQSILSYIVLDVISAVLGMTAGIILLAKNRSLKVNREKIRS